ncbi:hypothetical protein Taro_046648 [Colocasia esculenta]|uniref:Uncharacterized protein n=1 Tax=Colocasia esculenta TaxID=4460 RepID=A0A843WZK4_COLES|nr:hypothetical protein [Colocasia esculenta]
MRKRSITPCRSRRHLHGGFAHESGQEMLGAEVEGHDDDCVGGAAVLTPSVAAAGAALRLESRERGREETRQAVARGDRRGKGSRVRRTRAVGAVVCKEEGDEGWGPNRRPALPPSPLSIASFAAPRSNQIAFCHLAGDCYGRVDMMRGSHGMLGLGRWRLNFEAYKNEGWGLKAHKTLAKVTDSFFLRKGSLEFLPWLQQKCGREFSSVLSIENSTYGRSLSATRFIQAGECILKIPYSIHITRDEVPSEVEPLIGTGISDITWLALVLLAERRRGQDSEWEPYITSLPCVHDMHCSALEHFPEIFGDISFEDFIHAYSLVAFYACNM